MSRWLENTGETTSNFRKIKKNLLDDVDWRPRFFSRQTWRRRFLPSQRNRQLLPISGYVRRFPSKKVEFPKNLEERSYVQDQFIGLANKSLEVNNFGLNVLSNSKILNKKIKINLESLKDLIFFPNFSVILWWRIRGNLDFVSTGSDQFWQERKLTFWRGKLLGGDHVDSVNLL